MSNIFWKNLHLCFSGLKYCHPSLPALPQPSKQDHKDHRSPPPPDPSGASSLIKTLNSSYDFTSDATTSKSFTDDFFSSSDDSDTDSPLDFATLYASQRFFFSSPGRSNSIIESPDTRSQELSDAVTGGVAVNTYSPDPVADFRRSMQEMIEARERKDDTRSDWEYLHELLSCYLTLNPQHNHKYVIAAFTDLLVTLLSADQDHPR